MTFPEVLILPLAILIIILIGSRISCKHQKKEWNNRYCPKCGERWKSFDVDSSRAVGYK